jgi:hypothetical protein
MNEEELNPNGTRFDKIERTLVKMIDHHEAEFRAMRTWQVLAQDHMERLEAGINRLVANDEERGQRIDNLVSAIGKLIERIPPENLR